MLIKRKKGKDGFKIFLCSRKDGNTIIIIIIIIYIIIIIIGLF